MRRPCSQRSVARGVSDDQPTEEAPVPRLAACRVVTYSDSARLLLGGQLRALVEFQWSVVSGDEYPDCPPHLTVHQVPMRRELAFSDLRSFLELYRFFRTRRFRFVQTHTPKASLLGLPAARCAGLPTLYTMHGCLFFKDNTAAMNVLGWLFETWCCAWAKRVLVQSREDHEMVPKARICRRGKVHYIGNGIDVERFARVTPPPEVRDRPVVLMISRLVAEKGCREFFAVARSLHTKARFVHVGPVETDQRDAITADEMHHMTSKGFVEFLGPTDDVPKHLASCDLLLLPSFREGIPRAAMEAAAAGRPVVGYDVRGMREVIPPASGLLAPRGDTAALIELVSELVDDADRRAAVGQSLQDWVRDHFAEEKVVERLRQVYAEL